MRSADVVLIIDPLEKLLGVVGGRKEIDLDF